MAYRGKCLAGTLGRLQEKGVAALTAHLSKRTSRVGVKTKVGCCCGVNASSEGALATSQ